MQIGRPALSFAVALALLAGTVPAATAAQVGPLRALPSRPGSVSSPMPRPRSIPLQATLADNHLIVQLKGSVTADKLTRIYRGADTSAGAVGVLRGDTLSWRPPANTSPTQFADTLAKTGEVAYASPNYLRYPAGYTPPAFAEPDDPAYTDPHTWSYGSSSSTSEKYPLAKSWWIRNINAVDTSTGGKSAWKRGYTGPSIVGKHPLRADGNAVKVGVIDTGLYFDHPDIGDNFQAGTPDVTPIDPSDGPYRPSDGSNYMAYNVEEVSHGTCVAGEIAATADNGIGTLGVANDATVLVYKVYKVQPDGQVGMSDEDIIAALEKAANDGCKVINMSLAGPDASTALQEACDYAYARGCVIVAAAGNDGDSGVSYPAACNHVIAVGSIGLGSDGTSRVHSSFSNTGPVLDLVAPGEFIWGLTEPGYIDPTESGAQAGYTWWEGTSMASPIVAGGIAWLWRAMPSLSNSAITSLVESTARDLGSPGRDDTYGYGELDMDAAYAKLISSYPLLKQPAVTVTSGTNARNVRLKWTRVSGYDVTYKVGVDGSTVLSGLATTGAVLPRGTATGTHTVTVTPVSARNWADGTEVASVQISPAVSVPQALTLSYKSGKLVWTDTESGTSHSDLLSIDGGAAKVVTGDSWDASGLSVGTHVATLAVRDHALIEGAPKTISFAIREQPSVKRLTATDAAGYAAKLSARRQATVTSSAVLVSATSWADAAVAAPLARAVDGPVLVSSKNSLPSATLAELTRLGVRNVTIVGSTGVIGAAVQNSLVGRGFSVTRVSGGNRYTTADAVAGALAAREGGAVDGSRAVVVGNSPADALSAATVAASKGWPLVFSTSGSVPSATRSTLASIGVTTTLLVAQSSTVNGSAMAQLPGATRVTASSSAGVGASLATWATSHYPADFSGERFFIANPSPWDKNLGLAAEAAREKALVLTTSKTLSSATKTYYTAHKDVAVRTRIVGGSSTIADSVVSAIKKLVGAP